jgi:hypothetical protein
LPASAKAFIGLLVQTYVKSSLILEMLMVPDVLAPLLFRVHDVVVPLLFRVHDVVVPLLFRVHAPKEVIEGLKTSVYKTGGSVDG